MRAGGCGWRAPRSACGARFPPASPSASGPGCDADLVIPRVAVAELPDARVLGPHRVVIDRRGRMIEEFGLYWGTSRWSEHQVFWHPFPEPPLEVSGVLGVLAGRGDLSYYHFLLDIVPRLALFETPGTPTPDHWYVPLQRDWESEVLEMMGFLPRANVIDADAAPHVRAEALLIPGLPDVHLQTPPWTVAFLRERLRPAGLERTPGRRIYVTRGDKRNSRIVRNEREVVEMLASRGFTVVDPGRSTSVSDQIRIFGEAEWIVGPHGGGLANLLFASPGASVIELFAPTTSTPATRDSPTAFPASPTAIWSALASRPAAGRIPE